jgi:phosphate transport system substrate-binding protein
VNVVRFAGAVLGVTAALAMVGSAASCRRPGSHAGGQTATLTIDGSSTVYPILSALADDFGQSNPGVELIVDKSGTGSGMRKFCRGEIEVAAASRPISASEQTALQTAGIPFIELPFAFDGVSVIVSADNRFVRSITLPELRRAWREGSNVQLWSDIDPAWPKQRIQFFGPTDNHGTYDYFADALLSPGDAMRSDVQMNQEYNAIVEAVADNPYALGYVGLSYYDNNRDKVRALGIDTGSGPVVPSQESVLSGRYRKLSRPLLLYVSKTALEQRPELRRFLQFALSAKGITDIREARYVALPEATLAIVRDRLAKATTGTVFNRQPPFLTVEEITRLEKDALEKAAK